MKRIEVHATPIDHALSVIGDHITVETALLTIVIAWVVYLFK